MHYSIEDLGDGGWRGVLVVSTVYNLTALPSRMKSRIRNGWARQQQGVACCMMNDRLGGEGGVKSCCYEWQRGTTHGREMVQHKPIVILHSIQKREIKLYGSRYATFPNHQA